MFCGKCGLEVNKEDVFCPNCGEKIEVEDVTANKKSGKAFKITYWFFFISIFTSFSFVGMYYLSYSAAFETDYNSLVYGLNWLGVIVGMFTFLFGALAFAVGKVLSMFSILLTTVLGILVLVFGLDLLKSNYEEKKKVSKILWIAAGVFLLLIISFISVSSKIGDTMKLPHNNSVSNRVSK